VVLQSKREIRSNWPTLLEGSRLMVPGSWLSDPLATGQSPRLLGALEGVGTEREEDGQSSDPDADLHPSLGGPGVQRSCFCCSRQDRCECCAQLMLCRGPVLLHFANSEGMHVKTYSRDRCLDLLFHRDMGGHWQHVWILQPFSFWMLKLEILPTERLADAHLWIWMVLLEGMT